MGKFHSCTTACRLPMMICVLKAQVPHSMYFYWNWGPAWKIWFTAIGAGQSFHGIFSTTLWCFPLLVAFISIEEWWLGVYETLFDYRLWAIRWPSYRWLTHGLLPDNQWFVIQVTCSLKFPNRTSIWEHFTRDPPPRLALDYIWYFWTLIWEFFCFYSCSSWYDSDDFICIHLFRVIWILLFFFTRIWKSLFHNL